MWMNRFGGDSQNLTNSNEIHYYDGEEHNNVDSQEQGDSRNYNPYLIAYHEESNTFSGHTDPWNEQEEEHKQDENCNHYSSNNNHSHNNVELSAEVPPSHAHALPTSSTTTNDKPCDQINVVVDVPHTTTKTAVLKAPEVIVEHVVVQKVSLPHAEGTETTFNKLLCFHVDSYCCCC